MYMDVIKSLHVDYSPAKTHNSSKFYEFAKRIIYNGVEISPFPISSLKACSKNSDVLVLAIRESIKRGHEFSNVSLSVQLYFNLVKEFRTKLCKKIGLNSYYFGRILDCTDGIVPAHDVFNDILRKNNLPDNSFKEGCGQSVLDLALLKLFQNNILSAMETIKKNRLSSVLKSNDLLKTFYA